MVQSRVGDSPPFAPVPFDDDPFPADVSPDVPLCFFLCDGAVRFEEDEDREGDELDDECDGEGYLVL
jgi:hypothetical protein